MEYRVEELATAAGVRVDTVRFYQGRGLIPAPARVGRAAIYGDAHLSRLREIRSLLDQGFSLAQIGRLAESGEGDSQSGSGALLGALVEHSVGQRTYSREEFASETGLPAPLLNAVQAAGLIAPIRIQAGGGSEAGSGKTGAAGEERYTASDVALAKAGLALLDAGLPMPELLAIATSHVRNTHELAEAGIDLFDDFIRKAGASVKDDEATAQVFRDLLPEVTRLVALHFQRTLVDRALERLRNSGDARALELALEATESARLEVEWR